MILRRRRATATVLGVATVAAVLVGGMPAALAGDAGTAGAAGNAVAGATGAGDSYFPHQGNGGYDVSHYNLWLRYDPSTKRLAGVTTITARATADLQRFDLDLRRNLTASRVLVDGRSAKHAQPAAQAQELVITPARSIARGHTFTVQIQYGGTPRPVTDPDGSPDGFIPTGNGAFVASEPQGAPTWYPVNDTPRDKATYSVALTVPVGHTGVSNGHLSWRHTKGRWTTWGWAMQQPVSSYLVTAAMGYFRITKGRTPKGTPYYVAVAPAQAARSKKVLAKLPAIVDYYSSVYGKYPFGDIGAIVVNDPSLGYALETATRPLFASAPDEATLAHELAHQWFGDDVTLQRWRDIWLNEGFAEWSSWLWQSHHGGQRLPAHLRSLLAQPADNSDEWQPAPGNPGRSDEIFSDSVYDRGAGALEALREKIGDHAFFAVLRGWLVAHRYGTATVQQFTAYAQRSTGKNLTPLFNTWLYRVGKP